MEKVRKSLEISTHTKEITIKAKFMGKEFTFGQAENRMWAIFIKDSNMGMGNGRKDQVF